MTAANRTETSREETSQVELTQEERAWLKAHPEIVLGAPTDYPPMVIKRSDGTHVGVLVDLFEQISRRLNTRIGLHIEDSWSNIQKKAQNREIDGLAFGGRDPSRNALYNATDIVMSTYFSVFGRSRAEYQLKSFSGLDGMRIGYKRAARPTRSLLEKLPSAILKPYDSHESMTQALLSKEIDVIVAWMSYDHWRKNKMQGTIDNILLIEEYPMEMVTYVRTDWPELIPILNKIIISLQKDELPRLINKWFGEWPQRKTAPSVPLTPEERAWLDQNHTVQVRIADYPPYQIIKGSEAPQGISIEYLKLIEDRTGIEFKYEVSDQPFAEFLENMKQGRGPDMTALIMPTPEREQYLSFSEPYLSSPYVIFIRQEDDPIFDIQGLVGKTLAVPRAFVVQEQLSRDYPEIKLALFDSDEKALQAVATGQADAYIGSLTAASHIIHQKGLSHLKVAAAAPFGDQGFSIGTRKDLPELASIIKKSLASITEEEKTAIRNKYLAIKFEQRIDKAELLKWVFIFGGAGLVIVLIFLFWNRQLSREVKKRTAELTRSEAQYRGLVDNSLVGVFISTVDGRLSFVNDALCRIFDFDSPDQIIAKGVLERWRDKKDREKMLAELQKHGTVTNYEAEAITNDGRSVFVLLSARQIGEDIIGMVVDISKRKVSEEALRLSQEKANRLATKLVSFQEAEHSQIARELHDDIIQRLAFLNIEVDKLEIENKSLPHPVRDNLIQISGNLQKVSSDIHMISRRLHPSIVDDLGLLEAMRTECNNFTRINEVSINLDLDTTIHNPRSRVSHCIYRTLQEGLRNISKHANASEIQVSLTRQNDMVLFLLKDNGIGFDPDIVSENAGLGLTNMRERAKLANAHLSIESQPGNGTVIKIEVPLESGHEM